MLIDLSHPINNDTPVYPGDPRIHVEKTQDVNETDDYTLHTLSLGSHSGTHIDAPSHMIPRGPNVDEIDLATFVGDALCIDARNGLSVEALAEYEISENSIVLFNTGSHANFHDPSYFRNYPAMHLDIAKFLVQKKIKLVGIDTCSADNTLDFPVHKLLLKTGIPIIENLTNLDAVTGKNFKLYAFPINIAADGAPARVVAELDI